MSGFNLAATSKEEQDKVAVDLMASGVAYKERLAMPVVAKLVAREQPEHLRAYLWARLEHYRKLSMQLPDKMRARIDADHDFASLPITISHRCRS